MYLVFDLLFIDDDLKFVLLPSYLECLPDRARFSLAQLLGVWARNAPQPSPLGDCARTPLRMRPGNPPCVCIGLDI